MAKYVVLRGKHRLVGRSLKAGEAFDTSRDPRPRFGADKFALATGPQAALPVVAGVELKARPPKPVIPRNKPPKDDKDKSKDK